MTCVLYEHLKQKKLLAWARTEHAEVMRLNREIRDHLQTCAACNGLEYKSLAEKLFNLPVAKETL